MREITTHAGPWLPAPRPAPDGVALMAIGDVHGRADLLAALQEALKAAWRDLLADPARDVARGHLVYLGDYIDRGPSSSKALSLVARGLEIPEIAETALRGNHEEWPLAVLEGTADEMDLLNWEYNGGAETLHSLGLEAFPHDAKTLRPGLDAALGERRKELLTGLGAFLRLGDYLFVHAGLDPRRPLEDQDIHTMTWIREPFLFLAPEDWPFDFVVVHGHSPEGDIGRVKGYRINLDSGACLTGQLTALVIVGDRLRFIAACDRGLPSWETGPRSPS